MTQCPFPSPPQVDTALGFHALSEAYQCPNQFICLRSFPWDPNMRREQRVKIDVERRGITVPSIGQCRGIFYDPLRNRAAFSPEPAVALPEQSGTTFSERDDDLVKLGRRVDDAQGLHYVLVDLPDEAVNLALVPIKEENCFMLLFDTGKHIKVCQVESGKNLERIDGAQSYDWKARTQTELAAGSTETVTFADGLVTWLKLHKGRARILKSGPKTTDAFTMQNFKFAVCVAATPEKIGMQMDGILGMSHKTMDFGNANNSELLPWKLAQQTRLQSGPSPRVVIALDEDASKSWLVLNTSDEKDDSVAQNIPHEDWKQNWVPTISSRLFHWVFNVLSFSTPTQNHQLLSEGNHPIPLLMPFIIDTGTVYSYFPIGIFTSLVEEMRAGRSQTGQPYVQKTGIARLKSIPFSINFHHPKSKQLVEIKVGSLDMFVTKEPGPMKHTYLCSFLPGCIPARPDPSERFLDSEDLGPSHTFPPGRQEERKAELTPVGALQSEPKELFILGNYFLRHLVVEFHYGTGGADNMGYMRMAHRIRN
uniref:Peptidase A1 domain-containing protein n=1 Tax=Mycena chlorophos TaxID=658473 RepID=A0ABQ0LKD5_MYCCL|nr:predicted protein [Mycena chlorophos]